MLDLEGKINKLLENNVDPRTKSGGRQTYQEIMFSRICPPMLGIVVDNHDPEGLGRIRVSHEGAMPGSVSPWLPVVGHSRGNGSGFWTLPSTGTQALVAYTSGDRRSGYVLGFIYDGQHKPPEATGGKASGSILVQTKNHRIEITDSEGSGEIRIESAEGQMRAVIGSEGGITLDNELGGIGIRCRRLAMDCGGEAFLKSRSISIETEDNSEVRAGGKSTMEADGDATLKGKNIRLSGSKGVCAEGKQIAVQDDQVMGFDTHMMVVPSGSGTATVPLPHPFMGKMSGDLSEDVKIGGKGCAVKGSKAKHNDSSHMQLPGTIRFQSKPKCEGEVTGGTSAKVKIDGKEAAVIGSQVTTCNDMGARNNSTIMAVGSAMPMPAIINPQNAEEYRREREEKEKKKPAFQNVRWSKTGVEEGEEVELSAGVKDIADGNMVTLQVFHEGQGPGDGRALASIPLTVKDGAVSARWSWKSDAREMPPEADPKFIFTAHCAWCNFEKSGSSLEVKLKRPEITKVEWQDRDGNSIEKVYSTAEYILHIETREIVDDSVLTVAVFNNSTNEKIGDYGVTVNGDKADCKIKLPWINITDKEGCKLYFEVSGNRCKPVKSPDVNYPGPEFSNLRWLNQDDEEIDKIEYGTEVKLSAETKNLEEGDKVYIYLYRNSTENEDTYFRKASAVVQDNKINFSFWVKEDKELLVELGEDSEIKYIFVLVPEHYKMIRSEDSKELLLNFVFVLNIYDNPDEVNQNDKYILEDVNDGKKYKQERKVKDDLIANDGKITLKFENLKPGLRYNIKYILDKGNVGNIQYENISFADLLGE